MSRAAAISVDLDEVACYEAIHGVATNDAPADVIYDYCVPRLAELFASYDLRATFFVIGSSLERAENRERVRALHAAGHEIANHSYSHPYDLTRQIRVEIARDISAGADAIENAVGVRPVGFRAPGYTVTDALFEVLDELGVRYDSSVFPCPLYYGAKVATLGWMALLGRESQSIADTPMVLRASPDPYRVGRPYWKRGGGILELPIGVTTRRTGALPYIGTSLVLARPAGARWLTRRMLGRSFINLELHGIDVADADADGLAHLKPHQPDLRVALSSKLDALRKAIETMRDAGYRFSTLSQAAVELDTALQ